MLFQKKSKPPCVYKTPGGELSALYADMLAQPHLLIAGATGSGKSVVINGLLYSATFRAPGMQAGGVGLILIDPKRVELSPWRELPHVVGYASEPEQFAAAVGYALQIVECRYKEMQRDRLRLYPGGDVYIIIDEWADLILTNKKLMPAVQRLAQIGRAARVHLIFATQTPIAKVLPTEIKCNFDARLALRTRSAQDSRNIIGRAGCERLPRCGTGLYMTPEREDLTIIPMIPDAEILERVAWWTSQKAILDKRSPGA